MDIEKQHYNVKLFPIYKMLSWDVLFFYAIEFIFFTQVKNISVSSVFFASSFYPIFKLVFQLPCLILASKFKIKNSIIFGNILVALGILSYIIGNGVSSIIIANLFQAIGYNLKGVCETDLLYSSIPKNDDRGKIFSKIDGKSSSYYYYFDAIASVVTGFLFVINGYLPIILCFSICIVSTFISTKFYSPENIENNKINLKNEIQEFKNSFKFIATSKRLKSLLLFSALFHGLLCIATTLRSSLLVDMHLPNQYFGIVFALFGIITGISAKNSYWFHKKYKNETLMNFALTFTISFMVVGIVALNINNTIVQIIIIGLAFIVQYIIKGPYYTLIKRYFSNFSTSKLRPKIYTASNFVESIGRALMCLLASSLSEFSTTSYSFVIIGAISTIAFIFIISYMKPRVGLNPEQYDKKDIEYAELK